MPSEQGGEEVLMQRLLIEPIVRAALLEDLGRAGDITSEAIIASEADISAALTARQPGVLAGLDAALLAFELLDPRMRVHTLCHNGDRVERGQVVARIGGNARAVLAAERVALNLLCRASGVATATRTLADAIAGYKARIVCTRKTTPGLRLLEKEAVRLGGGANHRFGLDDAMLIKDNHVALAGGVRPALERARRAAGHLVKIELEVDTLDQLAEALECGGADAVLLDNMDPPALRRAVEMVGGRMVTEASGRITVDTAPDIAAAGVDLISSGWITHSAPILDLGLDTGQRGGSGYSLTLGEFQRLLTEQIPQRVVGRLLDKWFGYHLFASKVDCEVRSATGKTVDIPALHARIQADPGMQYDLYQVAQNIWR
jgi:nicotinate-nucleotide pyrophosphorylase (carboxylating)